MRLISGEVSNIFLKWGFSVTWMWQYNLKGLWKICSDPGLNHVLRNISNENPAPEWEQGGRGFKEPVQCRQHMHRGRLPGYQGQVLLLLPQPVLGCSPEWLWGCSFSPMALHLTMFLFGHWPCIAWKEQSHRKETVKGYPHPKIMIMAMAGWSTWTSWQTSSETTLANVLSLKKTIMN